MKYLRNCCKSYNENLIFILRWSKCNQPFLLFRTSLQRKIKILLAVSVINRLMWSTSHFLSSVIVIFRSFGLAHSDHIKRFLLYISINVNKTEKNRAESLVRCGALHINCTTLLIKQLNVWFIGLMNLQNQERQHRCTWKAV